MEGIDLNFNYLAYYDKACWRIPPSSHSKIKASLENKRFEYILSIIPKGGFLKILEAGCGEGELLKVLAEKGHKVIGTDISIKKLEGIKEHLGNLSQTVNLVHMDINALGFNKGRFDCIVCSEVLEHVIDPAHALKEMRRILDPQGILILTVPYAEKISLYPCIHCQKLTPISGHLHSFDRESIEALIRSAGFIPVSIRRIVAKGIYEVRFFKSLIRIPTFLWKRLDSFLCNFFDRAHWMLIIAQK